MGTEIVHDRIVVGLQKEEWTKVFYEPTPIPEDITIPSLAPEVALFSKSRGEKTDDEPLPGVTAWGPLFNPAYIPSSSARERDLLQRKILYDAWRYLVAKTPSQIAVIREQLQGSRRQKRLLMELDKARKARSNSIKQRDRKKARKLQLDPNVSAESIEKSDDDDDDSGLGSDTDNDGEDDDSDGDADRRRMPPPRPATPHRPSGSHRSSVARSEPMMSGVRGDSIDAENGAEDLDVGRRAGSAALSSGRSTPFTAARSVKRKQPFGPKVQRNVRARTEGQDLFLTPSPSGRRPDFERDVEDGNTLNMSSSQDVNGGLTFEDAMRAAEDRSRAPGEDVSVYEQNGGLDPDEAWRVARERSEFPESDTDL